MTNKIYLYHYKPLSTLEHFTHLKNFMRQKIWLTPVGEFNDPFEAQFDFKYATVQEIRTNKALFNKYYNIVKTANPQISENEFRNGLNKPEAEKMLGKVRYEKGFFHSFGAICLTSNHSNIPMWAHYANYHRGYCVIFEIDLDYLSEKKLGIYLDNVFKPKPDGSDQEILSFQQPQDDEDKHFIFTKVIYKECRPIIEEIKEVELHNSSQYEKIKYLVTNSFGVKFKQWAYEEEYRLVVNANSAACGLMDLRGYPFIKITGIILGHKFGHGLSKDAIDFINSYGLNNHNFKENCIADKAKEFVSILAQNNDIGIYHSECSIEKYEMTPLCKVPPSMGLRCFNVSADSECQCV